MSDASRLAASQYLLHGRFVLWGIATLKGFYGGGPYSFGASLSTRGSSFSLSAEIQEYAGAVCAIDSRKGSGPFGKGALNGELFGCVVYYKGGWSFWEGTLVLAHQGSPSGGDRVFGAVWLGEFLAK